MEWGKGLHVHQAARARIGGGISVEQNQRCGFHAALSKLRRDAKSGARELPILAGRETQNPCSGGEHSECGIRSCRFDGMTLPPARRQQLITAWKVLQKPEKVAFMRTLDSHRFAWPTYPTTILNVSSLAWCRTKPNSPRLRNTFWCAQTESTQPKKRLNM